MSRNVITLIKNIESVLYFQFQLLCGKFVLNI